MDKAFASRLKEMRKRRGYTQKQLATITQISVQSIRHYEQEGQYPNSEYLLLLAEALDITAEFLLRGSDRMNIYTEAVKRELKALSNFEQIKQIKEKELNSTILAQLELSETLISEVREEWKNKKVLKGGINRPYVIDVIQKYCQNRAHFSELFGIKDGALASVQ